MFKLSFIFLTLGLLTVSLAAKGTQTCPANFWQCADGSCIFLVGRCDNFPDCEDESDEKGCASGNSTRWRIICGKTVVCKEGQRPCSSGECINANFFCDGIINCRDAGDELAADCPGETTTKSNANTSTEDSLPSPIKSLTWTPRQVQDTTIQPSTSKPQKQRELDWGRIFAAELVNKPTTMSEPSLPDIIVPNIPPKTHISVQPIKSFVSTTLKYNIPDWAMSKVKETTTPLYQPRVSTIPYWFYWYNTTYQPTTSRTPCVEVDDRFEFCRKRYRGYYRHPNDCKQYIVCEWGFMHICTCPELTHWDLRALTCVWENTSPCITGTYDRPIIADQITMPVPPTMAPSPSTPLPSTTQISTTTSALSSSLPNIVPPLVRLRALPATPAWLKELTAKSFSNQNEPQTPRYQSLLTRFFKAMPHSTANENIRLS